MSGFTTGKNILLVEDEVILAMSQTQDLEAMGYCITHVMSGEEAVEKALVPGAPYDIILMDIDLGEGIDGSIAARKILVRKEIPILFVSSHIEPEIVEKTEKITSYGYVVKNSGITVLDASIKMAFKLFYAKEQLLINELDLKRLNEDLEQTNEELMQTNEELTQTVYQLEETQGEVIQWQKIMEQIVNHNPKPIAVLDNSLSFIFVSDSFLTDYKVTNKEVIGKHHYEVFPDIPEKWRDVHRRALKGEVLSCSNDEFKRHDGAVDHTNWECRPWVYLNGDIGGIILYTEVL